MIKNRYCPECLSFVVGLYQNIRNKNPTKQWTRRGYYCKNCDLIVKDDEVVKKVITYEKLE